MEESAIGRIRSGATIGLLCVATIACGGAGAKPAPAPNPAPPVSAAETDRPLPTSPFIPENLTLIGSAPGALPFDATPVVHPNLTPPAAPLELPKIRARTRAYRLPLKRPQVVNLKRDLLDKAFMDQPDEATKQLLRDGMAIGQTINPFDRFTAAYELLRKHSIPTVVTADSVLHVYHLYFSEILKALETQALLPLMEGLVDGLYRGVKDVATHADGPLVEPAANELAFLSVAKKLLDPAFEPHQDVAERVAKDVAEIERHARICNAVSLSSFACLRKPGSGRIQDPKRNDDPGCYIEDFSQYKPRGHYTQSQDLERYFKTAMWLGRTGHRVRHPNEVLQQAILVQAYQRASCQIGDETLTAAEAHDRIDRALEFLVGKSDDLTVSEVQPVLAQALGTGGDLRLLAQVQAMQKTQAALRRLRPPRILSTVMSKREDQSTGEAVKEQTQALRLLGQRYAADSEMLGRLVYGHVTLDPGHPLFQQLHLQCESIPERKQHELCDWAVGKERSQDACRLMPTSLDVAALLGSELANGYVAPARRYCGYTEQQRQLASQWSGDASRAPDTLYLAWLQALGPLLRPASRGYPTWMRGKPYDKKALRTALASWSELRHDTILYVKQSYTSKLVRISLGRSRPRPPEAYGIVEPQPELYARLKRLSVQTRLVLGSLKLLPGAVLQSLQEVEGVFDRLISITRKQLEGKDLSRDDERYIKSFGGRLQRLLSQLTVATTPPTRYEKIEGRPEDYPQRRVVEGQEDAFKTTLVADVHSEVNSGRALEEAVGPIEWLIVINPTADGQLSVAVGPVFSYYEFTRPLSDRMTDEEWRERLKTGGAPAPRWWTHDEPIAQGLETPRL